MESFCLLQSLQTQCSDVIHMFHQFSNYAVLSCNSKIESVEDISFGTDEDISVGFEFDYVQCFRNLLIFTNSVEESFITIFDLKNHSINIIITFPHDVVIRGNCAIDKRNGSIYVLNGTNLALNKFEFLFENNQLHGMVESNRCVDLMKFCDQDEHDAASCTRGYSPHSVAFFNNNIIVFYTICAILVLDMSGNKIRHFNFGRIMPSYPKMYVNTKGMIFVTNVHVTCDIKRTSIEVFDVLGNLLLSIPMPSNVMCMACGNNDEIYVCFWGSASIIHVYSIIDGCLLRKFHVPEIRDFTIDANGRCVIIGRDQKLHIVG